MEVESDNCIKRAHICKSEPNMLDDNINSVREKKSKRLSISCIHDKLPGQGCKVAVN